MNWAGSWNGVGVSVIGNDHVRREMPLQDVSAAILSPRPAAVVCDGAGSASNSHDGANAAVREFRIALSALEPSVELSLDSDEVSPLFAKSAWRYAADGICRSVVAAKAEAARTGSGNLRDYDFTFAAAVVGRLRTGFIQVGDGAICTRTRKGVCDLVFKPQKGRYANETSFLTDEVVSENLYLTNVVPTSSIDGVLLMSDGPEVGMIDLGQMRPAPIVSQMIGDCGTGELDRASLLSYLTGLRWMNDSRGGDDKSVVVLARGNEKERKEVEK